MARMSRPILPLLVISTALACAAVPPPKSPEPDDLMKNDAVGSKGEDDPENATPKLDDLKSRLDVIDGSQKDTPPAKLVVTYATMRSELIKRYLALQGFDPNAPGDTTKAPQYKERKTTTHDDKLRAFEGQPLKDWLKVPVSAGPEQTSWVGFAKLLLSRTIYSRANLYLGMGKDAEAARELAPSLFTTGPGDVAVPLLDCDRESAPSCLQTVAAFVAKLPNLCARVGGVNYACRRLVEDDLLAPALKTEASKIVFVDAVVSSATKGGDGSWTIVGTDYSPDSLKDCATPAPKSTDPRAIWAGAEHDTWCANIKGAKLKGVKVTYTTKADDVPIDVHVGDSVRFIVEPKKVNSTKKGDVTMVTVPDALVSEVAVPDGTRYRWGSNFDWQFQGFKPAKP
jgi:hypothetical protein